MLVVNVHWQDAVLDGYVKEDHQVPEQVAGAAHEKGPRGCRASCAVSVSVSASVSLSLGACGHNLSLIWVPLIADLHFTMYPCRTGGWVTKTGGGHSSKRLTLVSSGPGV